jgi:thioredoxin reductase (NADPH)
MQQRALENPKIEVIWDSAVDEVLGDEATSGVRLRNLKTGDVTDYPTDGLFVAIGHDPNTAFLEGAVATDDKGYIVPVEHTRPHRKNCCNAAAPLSSLQRRANWRQGLFESIR